jgi:hypothetical protein
MTREANGSPDAGSLDISVQPGPVVAVSGEIDIASGPQLREQLLCVINRRGARLAPDLSGVTFIDCAGINGSAGNPSSRSARWRVAARAASLSPCPQDTRADAPRRGAHADGWTVLTAS